MNEEVSFIRRGSTGIYNGSFGYLNRHYFWQDLIDEGLDLAKLMNIFERVRSQSDTLFAFEILLTILIENVLN
jgi:hypothetical protein